MDNKEIVLSEKEELKNKIDANYAFIREMENHICDYSGEDRILWISFIGLMYSSRVTGVYSSDYLEKELAKLGNAIEFDMGDVPNNGKVLHVITEAAYVGGHTVLANNWINWDNSHESSIVFTDMPFVDVPDFLRTSVKESGGKLFFLSGGYFEKTRQLLKISCNFERIILHTHMYDVLPVLAYSNKNFKVPVFFCNHADFRFSFGFSISDCVVNICDYDIRKNTEYRGIEIERNAKLQFPGNSKEKNARFIEQKKKLLIRKKYGISPNCRMIISMGADYKYQGVLEYHFDSFVEKLMKDCDKDMHFYIIGADSQKQMWNDLNQKTNNRVTALGILPREDAEVLISDAWLYIASFPMAAVGADIACKYGVPNLTYMIIDRHIEYFGTNIALTEEELLRKSYEVLRGNKSKYIGDDAPKHISQKEWNKVLAGIEKKYCFHSNYNINTKRRIGVQEYINYNILQADAIGSAEAFFRKNEVKKPMFLLLEKLEKEYNVAIIPWGYINRLHNEAIILKKAYMMSIKWLQVNQLGLNISDVLKANKLKKVAIYGMHYLGQLLFELLDENEINVICGIDINAHNIHSKLAVITPWELSKDLTVDVIINTTVYDNSVILEAFQENVAPIISLDCLLDETLTK